MKTQLKRKVGAREERDKEENGAFAFSILIETSFSYFHLRHCYPKDKGIPKPC
jgi:hypothetical protein